MRRICSHTRFFAIALILGLMLALLGGCADDNSSQISASNSSSIPESTAEAEQTEQASGQPEQSEHTDQQSIDEPSVLPSEDTATVKITQEPTTYSLWMSLSNYASPYIADPAAELTILREIADRTNIYFDVTYVVPETEEEKFHLMTAGGDYCDIISLMDLYPAGIEAAIEDEIIRDIYEEIRMYAPNYWDVLTQNVDDFMAFLTDSGYIGTLGMFLEDGDERSQQYGLIINQGYLEGFGMDTPKTYDDFHSYLTQAHAEHEAYYSISSDGVETALMAGFNVVADMIVVDGQVRYGYLEDGMYDYFKLLSQWYSEGFIEENFYDGQTHTGLRLAGTADGTMSAWSGTAGVMVNIKNFEDPNSPCDYGSAPFPVKTEADTIHVLDAATKVRDTDSWSFSTSLDDEGVINLLKLVNYMFTDEGYLLYNYGVEGEAHYIDENGDPQWTDLVINNPTMEFNAASYIYASHTATYYMPAVMNMRKSYYSFTDAEWTALETFSNMGDDEYAMPVAVTLTAEESERYSNISSDVETFISETVIQWIISDTLNEDVWEAFLQQLHGLNVDEMISIYQDAYNRYLDNVDTAIGLIKRIITEKVSHIMY